MSIRTGVAVFGGSLALLTGAAAVAAGPALAKSGVSFSVSPRVAHVGQSVGVYAAGGDDNVSSYTEVCVERLVSVAGHSSWSVLRCTPPTPGYAGGERLHVALRFDRPQRVSLRAQLVRTDARGGHRVGRQATAPVTVTVVR